MTLTQVKTFQPGQVRTASVTVLNDGNVATVYALEITAGETGFFGFASQRPPVLVLTPPVSPGLQRQIDLPVQLPDAPGPKAFRIRIGQAGPTGQIIQEFDEELFTGLAEVVQLPAEIPLPTEVPAPPAPPTAQELALQFRDALGSPSITVRPTQVEQGETVSGNLSIPSAAAMPFTPRLTVILVEFQQTAVGDRLVEVRTLIAPKNITLAAGADISEQFTIDTSTIPPGLYGLRVHLMDPATGIVFIDQSFTELFTVAPPPGPTPAPAPPPAPTPTPTLALDLVSVVVRPSTVRPLSTIAIDVTVRNTSSAPGQLEFRAQVINDIGALPDLSGRLATRNNVPIGANATITQSWTWTVPDDPADYPAGRQYGVFVAVLDEPTRAELIVRSVRPLFTIAAPVPVDEELAPPAPSPTPKGSDIAVTINYVPTSIDVGDPEQTVLTVTVTNVFGDFNFGVEVDARLTLPDPGGSFSIIGQLAQQIIPPTFGLLIVDQRRTFTGALSTRNLPFGSYGAQVTVRSFETKEVIKVVSRAAILAILRRGTFGAGETPEG